MGVETPPWGVVCEGDSVLAVRCGGATRGRHRMKAKNTEQGISCHLCYIAAAAAISNEMFFVSCSSMNAFVHLPQLTSESDQFVYMFKAYLPAWTTINRKLSRRRGRDRLPSDR